MFVRKICTFNIDEIDYRPFKYTDTFVEWLDFFVSETFNFILILKTFIK